MTSTTPKDSAMPDIPDPDPTTPPVDFVNRVGADDPTVTLAPDQSPVYHEEA